MSPPVGGAKKGADKRKDGHLYFCEDPRNGKTKQIIISTKLDHLKAGDVKDVPHVVDREKAQKVPGAKRPRAEQLPLVAQAQGALSNQVKLGHYLGARFLEDGWCQENQ